jgi:hypothetical protein
MPATMLVKNLSPQMRRCCARGICTWMCECRERSMRRGGAFAFFFF